ncbi:MAG: hypothetical protein ACLPKW_35800 [Acetobacteraceae bacterium]
MPTPQQDALPVEDYRQTGASRLNNPPATVLPPRRASQSGGSMR